MVNTALTQPNAKKSPPRDNHTITAWIVVFGALATIIALVITFILPTKTDTFVMADGFMTPIIAFELARSPMDLGFLTGDTETAHTIRQSFRRGLMWDMLFPFLYGGFILLLLIKALRTEGDAISTMTKIGVVSALSIPLADLAENWAMLQILDRLDAHQELTGRLLPNLELTTWIKWLLIATAFGALMLHFYERTKLKQSNQTMPAIISGMCFFISLVAFFSLHPLLGELMAFSVTLCIAYFLVKNSRELLLHLKK